MKKRFQGREFEYLFRQDTKIILWGSANIGLRFLDFYAKHLNIVKLCDGSTEKVGTQVGYMMVSDPSEIVYDESTVVIVTCSFYQEIRPILEAKGFRHHVSLFYYDDFEEIYRLYIHGKLCSHRIDISLTERCTLKCRDCNMWMTHFREPKEQPVEDVLNDIDLYFSTVDFVREMELLGGEPLLYADIAKVFRYVREVYTERVGKLVLFTNGTLLPSQELLELM
ncbi:MAG: radical SAM protein, partial [Selenomonas sp.]|nr:radical SAM protein [Selenomonas sp.]